MLNSTLILASIIPAGKQLSGCTLYCVMLFALPVGSVNIWPIGWGIPWTNENVSLTTGHQMVKPLIFASQPEVDPARLLAWAFLCTFRPIPAHRLAQLIHCHCQSHSVQRYWILKQFWVTILNSGRSRMRMPHAFYLQIDLTVDKHMHNMAIFTQTASYGGPLHVLSVFMKSCKKTSFEYFLKQLERTYLADGGLRDRFQPSRFTEIVFSLLEMQGAQEETLLNA